MLTLEVRYFVFEFVRRLWADEEVALAGLDRSVQRRELVGFLSAKLMKHAVLVAKCLKQQATGSEGLCLLRKSSGQNRSLIEVDLTARLVAREDAHSIE